MANFLENLLGLSDSSWKDRVREEIVLTSPNRQPFFAKWQGSPRSVSKTLGIFKYPKIKGALVQDMDVGADTYPMTIFFDGSSNDLDAGRFFSACKETGVWVILHPIHGPLELNLVSAEEVDDPTESGNVTAINTNWIEPLDPTAAFSLSQIGAAIQTLGSLINLASSKLFSNSVNQSSATFIQAIRNISNVSITAVNSKLAPTFEQDAETASNVAATIRGINDTLLEDSIDALLLAGQFQQLIQNAMQANDQMESRLDGINNYVDDLILTAPTEPTIENKNFSSTLELNLVSAVISASQIVTTSELFSRKESLNSLETFTDIFNKVVNALDGIQNIFLNNAIDNQYLSMLDTYPDLSKMAAQTADYLIKTSFDLAIEKTFILREARNPLEITVTEYGSLGDNDENLDLFIDTNKLKGNEILILPPGKSVVVYV